MTSVADPDSQRSRNFCLDLYSELEKIKAGSGINHSGSATLQMTIKINL